METNERLVLLQEQDRCIKLIEKQRQKVLENKDDPTWTEHFADLIVAIRSGEEI